MIMTFDTKTTNVGGEAGIQMYGGAVGWAQSASPAAGIIMKLMVQIALRLGL